jgi:hypothetical protein
MMIVYEADWLTPEMFENAVATATTRLGSHPSACGSNALPKA